MPVFPAVISPLCTLNTVCRRVEAFGSGAVAGCDCSVAEAGGGTEKRARSCGSVSRIRAVMS